VVPLLAALICLMTVTVVSGRSLRRSCPHVPIVNIVSRVACAILSEQHEEWQVNRRYLLSRFPK